MQGPMPPPGFPSAAAVNTTFMVGRALGSAVGTVMGNVAAPGVGATMGVASSVSQVAAHALRRNPPVMLPNCAFQPALPLLDEQGYHTPTAAAPPPAEMPNGESESAASASQTVNPSSRRRAGRESTASASHAAAPTEETIEPKEEPTSDEAQRDGLQEPTYDFNISDECQGVIGANPELKTLVEQLVSQVSGVAKERN